MLTKFPVGQRPLSTKNRHGEIIETETYELTVSRILTDVLLIHDETLLSTVRETMLPVLHSFYIYHAAQKDRDLWPNSLHLGHFCKSYKQLLVDFFATEYAYWTNIKRGAVAVVVVDKKACDDDQA